MVIRGTYDKRDILTDAKLKIGLGSAVAEDLGNDPQVKNIITLNKPTTPYDLKKKS
jgi:hypothetical protein